MTTLYCIWRRHINDRFVSEWFITAQRVNAVSDKHARAQVRRRFAKAGFHSMALVAVPLGTNPNKSP